MKLKFGRLVDLPKSSHHKITIFIRKRPLTAFVVALGLLLLLIILGSLLKKPVKEVSPPQVIKEVNVLSLGKQAVINISAQIEKRGVIQIIAQTSGIVSHIQVKEGETLKKGRNLISLSSNYQGGNTASISRQIASKQYQNTKDTFDTQKDILNKQKEVAEQNATNTEELRKIASNSNDDTKSLLSLNQDILSSINLQLDNLVANNQGGTNDQLILQTKQSKAGLQQAINSLQNAIRSADYSNNTNNSPTKLANLNKEITLQQLDLQEKGLVLSKELAQLQLSLASVNEAMMFPASPCAGTVQKIDVVKGDLVNPGTSLLTISCDNRSVKVVAKVTQAIAKQVSILTESKITIDGQSVFLMPDFISTEATDGQLYQIIFTIPEYLEDNLTNNSFVTIELPIGEIKKSSLILIPLDSVFQTQENAYVYVLEGDQVISKNIKLGEVLGSNVEVLDGLNSTDKIILNRNVIAGDKVRVKNE